MLWMLITPKAVVTPQFARNAAMRSPTVPRSSDNTIPEPVVHQATVRLRRATTGSSRGSGIGAPTIAEIAAAAAQVSAVILP